MVRRMHKLLYRDSLPLDQAVAAMGALRGTQPEADIDIETMLTFLAGAKRGIVR